jgi:Flp pilus assembly protein TadB
VIGWRRVLGQAGLMMAGGAFLIAAGGLVAVAAWLLLSGLLGPVEASLAVAGACLLTGLILLALSRRRPRQRAALERDAALRAMFAEAGLRVPEKGESPPLAEAFLFGLTVALRLNRESGR